MVKRRLHLKIVHSQPCTQAWESMHGDSKSRHCDECDKQVHNFAGMTPREIEKLLAEKEGRLCARIVRDADGSVQTLDQQPRQPLAAGFVLAASLAMGTAAAAQTTNSPNTARLFGTVLSPDGSSPMKGISVSLVSGGETVTSAVTDELGDFKLDAEPGRYDVLIWRNIVQRSRIPNVGLHAGEQIVPPLRVGFDEREHTLMVTSGAMEIAYRYPISDLFTHPIRYLKNIRHQL